MNTFKTAVVLATLVGVGYGVHVVLNKPIPRGTQAGASAWNDLPDIRYDELQPPDLRVTPEPTAPPPLDATPGGQTAPSVLVPPPVVGATTPVPASNNVTTPTSPPPAAASLASAPAWNDTDKSLEPPASPAAMPLPGSSSAAAPEFANANNVPNVLTPPTADQPIATTAPAGASDGAYASDLPDPPATLPVAANVPVPAPSGAGGFEEVWQSAQAKLAAGQFADALFALSIWYNDPNLSVADRDRLVPLLDQLAGTVIYSREHHLAPQFTAQGGETLQQIALQYNVPEEFLSRVNGVPTSSSLSPGQTLKVVPGPFRAELDLTRRQLTLFLDRYYAGRFSVGVGRDLPPEVMQMKVTEKSGPRPYRDVQTNHEIAAGEPNNPYGDHWIGLQDSQQPTNSLLCIHAWGSAVDAADTRGCVSVDTEGADDLKAILSIGSTVTVLR